MLNDLADALAGFADTLTFGDNDGLYSRNRGIDRNEKEKKKKKDKDKDRKDYPGGKPSEIIAGRLFG